jgi:hypothetical protein
MTRLLAVRCGKSRRVVCKRRVGALDRMTECD